MTRHPALPYNYADRLTLPISKARTVQGNCKPNSVCAFYRGENHLSQQPYPSLWSFRTGERTAPSLLFGLAPGGVFRAPAISRRAVVSYTTFSPLPRSRASAPSPAVYSLWHFPSARLETCRPRVSHKWVTWRRVLWCSDFPLPVARKRSSVPLNRPHYTTITPTRIPHMSARGLSPLWISKTLAINSATTCKSKSNSAR